MDDRDIRRELLDGPVASRLIAELQADFVVRYGGPDDNPTSPEEFAPPSGEFLVAYRGEEPLACGGFRRVDDTVAELKRMYVVSRARRTGVARALLSALERSAAAMGYETMKLEAGTAQPEAIGFYTAAGYQPITGFGYYAAEPLSRSFSKVLGGSPSHRP
ncbi:MAG: GNAT family N-acetyltransferase [Euzebyales bacterium]|nr:GNAT family N-acetyltransferase [Euzebyales bacterium]